MGEARKYVVLLVFIATWYAEPVGKSVKLRCNLGTIVLEVYRSVSAKCIWEIPDYVSF